MAATPRHIKVSFDLQPFFTTAATHARRRIGVMNLAVELSSEVAEAQIESVLETLRANEGHDKSNADARWIAEVTPDFEKMVTDGLAWLIATQEYAAALDRAPHDHERHA